MSENNASVFAFYLSVHFFAVPCKTTTPGFVHIDGLFLHAVVYLNWKDVPTNSAPRQFSHIRQIKLISSDVFLGVVVVLAP